MHKFHQTIPELISQGPGPTLRWFPEDVSISNLAANLVGMANTEGGCILIGISPKGGYIQGTRSPEKIFDRIFQAALRADPPLVLPLPVVETIEEKNIVRVIIPRGLPHVYNLDGRYLGCTGQQLTPIAARTLRTLLVNRGLIQFESRVPPGISQEDLDLQAAAGYFSDIDLFGNEDLTTALKHRGVLKTEGGTLTPTYAAVLLFGKHPQEWLPGAAIIAARFPGTSISDHFVKQEIGGRLSDQIEQAEVFIRDNLRSVVRLVGLRRQETLEYPLEAIRELLVNAVAHRDYSQPGDTIHIHIFSDRLEIRSPGGLPGPVNLKNLLEARFSRNAVIAQVLSDLGYVERLGYGLNRVLTVMRQNGLPQPEFDERDGTFRAILYSGSTTESAGKQVKNLEEYAGLNLNQRQERAINFLASHGRITNSEYQSICPEVSSETLRRDLVALVKKGALIKIGDKRATYYILKEFNKE